jgi:hypothetical protein
MLIKLIVHKSAEAALQKNFPIHDLFIFDDHQITSVKTSYAYCTLSSKK